MMISALAYFKVVKSYIKCLLTLEIFINQIICISHYYYEYSKYIPTMKRHILKQQIAVAFRYDFREKKKNGVIFFQGTDFMLLEHTKLKLTTNP